MSRIVRTAQAEEDLIGIWLYIAADNPKAADALLDKIDAAFQRLAQNPQLGPARPDLAPPLRYYIVGSYLILYQQVGPAVEIIRVLHGARHLPNLT